jgi:hypothetical protein
MLQFQTMHGAMMQFKVRSSYESHLKTHQSNIQLVLIYVTTDCLDSKAPATVPASTPAAKITLFAL